MSSRDDNTATLLSAGGGSLGRILRNNDILLAAGVAMVLATMLVPLPTFMLDMMLSCSIAIALATMVTVLSANESIELSTFPSLLLFVTLFRLSLNVASTRLILLQGDAGRIIETFGSFVVGGNLVIGLIVFLILVIIQFIVITKGAERISEVAARFNLDAMPGKQMAIDADLNAGIIGEHDAKERREKIVTESEFYGAMDGSSKFIRGDAIAGLIITAINLIGGFVMGVSRGMDTAESIETYAILAIGDGLVSQIPALIISSSAGFLISKASTKSSLGAALAGQMLRRARPLQIAAFLMAGMLFVPGFPKAPFALLAILAGSLAAALRRNEKAAARKEADERKQAESAKPEEVPVEELLEVDRICLQVGPRLVKLVDPNQKNSLSHRISPLRRKFAQQYGVVLPLVRLRDNVALDPNGYEIRINDHVVAEGRLQPDKFMAMDPGTVQNPIEGQPAQEPVFNLPALWVDADRKEDAEVRGYTVVDPETILVTHLSETLRRHASELLSRDDVQLLVDKLRERQPALVNGVIEDVVPMGLLHRVLQNLLKDGIPVRDLAQIVETLGDSARRTKDPSLLTEVVRKGLVRTITEQHTDPDGRILAIVMAPATEYELRNALNREGDNETLSLSPERTMELARRIADAWKSAMEQGFDKTVLLCDYRVRPHVAGILARQVPQLPVIAYDEVAPGTQIESVATINLPQAQPEPAEV